MIPQAEPNVAGEREFFLSEVLEGQFRPAEIFFAIMVALGAWALSLVKKALKGEEVELR